MSRGMKKAGKNCWGFARKLAFLGPISDYTPLKNAYIYVFSLVMLCVFSFLHMIPKGILKKSLSFFWFLSHFLPPFFFLVSGTVISFPLLDQVRDVVLYSFQWEWFVINSHNQILERKPWIVEYIPGNVHVVFAGGGFAPIRGSRIGKRPVAIPGARKSGIGKRCMRS